MYTKLHEQSIESIKWLTFLDTLSNFCSIHSKILHTYWQKNVIHHKFSLRRWKSHKISPIVQPKYHSSRIEFSLKFFHNFSMKIDKEKKTNFCISIALLLHCTICLNTCPWTLSVPQGSCFSLSHAWSVGRKPPKYTWLWLPVNRINKIFIRSGINTTNDTLKH